MLIKGHFFPKQENAEKIKLFIRRHIITYAPWVLFIVLLVILPWIIIGTLNSIDISISTLLNSAQINPDEKLVNQVIIVLLTGYYLFISAYFFLMWIDFYLDIIIVTPEHLINIQQIGLLNHKVSEQSLLRVQDVTSRVDGFWQTFFRYGTVVAETAGDEPNFLMRDVPNPNSVANIILKLHEELIESGGLKEELGESVGLNRPKPVVRKRKEMINKIVYNLPPNRGIDSQKLTISKKTNTQKPEDTIELEDSKVVVIQTPKLTRKITKDSKISKEKPKIKKIETSQPKLEIVDIEPSWISSAQKDRRFKKSKEIDRSIREGELKEGKEIRL